ncbi:MAG: universal stress protein [Rhizobiales bacterium]|nr:universal stress protein [Hyphomicrobiales bacterium]
MLEALKGFVMKKILVAVDGSTHADHALRLSADLAEKYQAELLIVHVVDDKPLANEERHLADVEFGERMKSLGIKETEEALAGYGAAGLGGYLRSQSDRNSAIKQILGEELLLRAKDDVGELDGAKSQTILLFGDPAEQILQAAESNDANLIVIGSRGLSDLKGLWLGSVSHKVSNLSSINVVTVR